MAPKKKEVPAEAENKPIFALRPPKRPALPRHSVAMKAETVAALDKYVTWAAGAAGTTYDEAQALFLEYAIPEIIGKDGAYKAHQKAQSEAAKKTED